MDKLTPKSFWTGFLCPLELSRKVVVVVLKLVVMGCNYLVVLNIL